jgi:hypothetical protein
MSSYRAASKFTISLPGIVVLATGIAVMDGDATWQAARAQAIKQVKARVVATGIPGASAISQVGTFLNSQTACARPIPTLFPQYIKTGAVLDPNNPGRQRVEFRRSGQPRAGRLVPVD